MTPPQQLPKADSQFREIAFHCSEIQHRYGKQVHILSDPLLLTRLAKLCSEDVQQPMLNELISSLYESLLHVVVNREFPRQAVSVRTRMAASHPEGLYQGQAIHPATPTVSVNLARAGTVPSHVCYMALNAFMNPPTVRQDHISIGRTTDATHQVTGSQVSGHKIGGSIEDHLVLFPDPMGATGSTLVEALDLYKRQGKAMKYVSMHCIVTPEYLKKVTSKHPDLVIYAIRLDRGLSPPDVLDSIPGEHWERERGLNDQHYIIPGGGGFGEVLNNAYV